MRPALATIVLSSFAIIGACDDGSGPWSARLRIAPVGGDRQADSVGRPLAEPLRVLVTDGSGVPQAGVSVRWEALWSGGSIPARTPTDSEGIAAATFTLGLVPGRQTVQAALDGAIGSPVTFTAFAQGDSLLIAEVPVPPNYGIHDMFVRDGLAFVSAWHTGVMIFDVGNGLKGGRPATPVLVSTLATAGGQTHNAWWFHNPVTTEKRYLFVGQEGPGVLGASSSGDIHVLDVSDLERPAEVAFFHLNGAGTHNFWMDEGAQRLYAAYYNAGVVALDVSGVLSGNLAGREVARVPPGGPDSTYTWSVQLANGALYAIDMVSGLWQLDPAPLLAVRGGGRNVPERYSSDFWVHGEYAYSGTWNAPLRTGAAGAALKVWRLDGSGAPSLVDSVVSADFRTVSDVEVSPDGRLLMFSAEGGAKPGVHFYSLANPAAPALVRWYPVSAGVHTATFGVIGGCLYAFAAKNPTSPALLIFDVTALVP